MAWACAASKIGIRFRQSAVKSANGGVCRVKSFLMDGPDADFSIATIGMPPGNFHTGPSFKKDFSVARSRNIKPSIFRNEILGTIDPLITLLFESLWCLADRDGKLEDRPLRIKADTFPYRENIDINGYLTVLAQHGFIKRYLVTGVAIIQVSKFKEHQSPHNTERASVLPDEQTQVIENKQETVLTVSTPLKDAGLTAALPPEPVLLIPDSLIPDSLIAQPSITEDSVSPHVVLTDGREGSVEEKQQPSVVRRASKKCPDDFEVTEELKSWAAVECPGVNLDKASARFRDHTFDKAKTDWRGTWRNWIRRDAEHMAEQSKLPAWREQQRSETQKAVPLIALGGVNPTTFFENLGVKNVTTTQIR